MAIKEDNYWGRNKRTPSTNKQIRKPATSSGNNSGLSDADLAILQAQLRDPQKAAEIGQQMADPFVKDIASKTAAINIGAGVASVPDMGIRNHVKPVDDPNLPSLGSSFGGGAANGAGDIASAISGIAGSLFGGTDSANGIGPSESPEALYERLRKEAGQYTYNGPSAHEMAGKEFDPQFALLDQLDKQQTSRYNSNKADIAGMYKALVGEANAGRTADQQNFKGAVDATGKNYADASANVTNNASAYSQAMADQLARLGIKEGAGDITGGVQNNLQDNLGRLNAQGANTKDLLTNLGANEYAFDTRNIGTTAQAGVNTQEQFLQDYMNRMDNNSNQRLQLTGQRGAAENNYGMQIQKLLQDGMGQQSSSINDAFKSIMAGQQQNTDNYFKQAGLDLDLSKFDFQKQQALANQQTNDPTKGMNPYDALQARALQQFGDPNKAREAVNQILKAYQENPRAASIGDFLNNIDPQSGLNTTPEMTSLLYDFMNRVMATQGRN